MAATFFPNTDEPISLTLISISSLAPPTPGHTYELLKTHIFVLPGPWAWTTSLPSSAWPIPGTHMAQRIYGSL